MTDSELLEEYGWILECESPLEIRHEDGSFASGQAAAFIIEHIKKKSKRKKKS